MNEASSKIATLARQGFIYSAGNFLNKVLLFLMVPLFAYFILPEDLALLEILDPAEQFIFGILNLGLINAFYRYYTKAWPKQDVIPPSSGYSFSSVFQPVSCCGCSVSLSGLPSPQKRESFSPSSPC